MSADVSNVRAENHFRVVVVVIVVVWLVCVGVCNRERIIIREHNIPGLW